VSSSPSVLIVRLDAIGDALTLVPLVAALREHGARIGAVLRPANAEVFARRAFDDVYIDADGISGLVPPVQRAHYDYALIPTEKPEGYRLAFQARIPHRIGFQNGWGKPFKTLWVRALCTQTIFRTAGLDPLAPHECEVVFSLGRPILGPEEPSRDPAVLRRYVLDDEPAPDARVVMQITDKWERLGARFEDVVDLAHRVDGMAQVRWISAASESEYGKRFEIATGLRVEYFENLRTWKAAIAAARAVVAPDSGAVHVAGMTGTPVLACFASAHFVLQTTRWAPWAAPYRVVSMEGAWPLVAGDALAELLSDTRGRAYKG
jgi:ADP-heptose:LPS heptosyltransferase